MQHKIIKSIIAFIEGKISAPDFETEYMNLWRELRDSRSARVGFSDDELERIDRIFTAVDCYCSIPHLRGADDLDEHQLWAEVAEISAPLLKKFRETTK